MTLTGLTEAKHMHLFLISQALLNVHISPDELRCLLILFPFNSIRDQVRDDPRRSRLIRSRRGANARDAQSQMQGEGRGRGEG